MGGVGSGGSKPRKPSHLRALEGVREDRLNRDEPIPARAAIAPPVELSEAAQAVWERLAPDLIDKKILTAWDTGLFAAYCDAEAMYHQARAEVESSEDGAKTKRRYHGWVVSPAFRVMQASLDQMKSLGSRFGLTPADRAQLKVNDDGGSSSGAARLLS